MVKKGCKLVKVTVLDFFSISGWNIRDYCSLVSSFFCSLVIWFTTPDPHTSDGIPVTGKQSPSLVTITFDGLYGMPSPAKTLQAVTGDGPPPVTAFISGPSQMDRRWMYYAHRLSTEYREGVTEFVTFADNDRKSRMSMHMLCPCRDCKNEQMIEDKDEVHAHLIMNGFMKKYTCWTKHGEQEAPDVAAEEVLDQDVENTAAAREGMFVPSPLGGETIDLDTQCLSTMLHDIEDAEDNDRDFEKFRPRQLGNDIDVFLEPIIDDFERLWNEGTRTWDAYAQEYFNLHVMLFCTMNDYSALGNLSGQTMKGKWACSECMEETRSKWLKHSHKTVYMGHRRFLPRYHPYRNMRKNFNGHRDTAGPPAELTGTEVHNLVMGITNEFGKKRKVGKRKEKSTSKEKTEEHVEKQKTKERSMWKKKSIFWRLPYWMNLEVRHCIDLMHVEKNVCESLMGLLLNPGTTKDGLNARRDLEDMGVRSELHPITTESGRVYLPLACYTLSKEEKIDLLTCLSGIKVPFGYSSRISRLVSLQDLNLVGMKSHDCHVFITQLLPVAIRNILPPKVRHTIQRLCSFFHAIGQKIILRSFMTQMYPCERYLGILKGYVRNRSHPEGSIIESYTTEEVIDFCVDYMSETSSIGLPRSHHEGRLDGVGTIGRKTIRLDRKVYDKAHFTGPEWSATTWQGYDINGYTFHTVKQDNKCTVQNSGLRIEAASDGGRRDQYYGRVEQILELDYLKFKVPFFRCRWVDLRNVKVDNEGFTTVNLANNAYKDEPFVLAKQVVQVFYIVDPCNKKLHVVREGKRRIVGLENIADEDDYNQHVHGIGQEIPLEEEEEEDEVQYARVDHEE
uniref:Transposon protein n=1 Tax=Oryza sativa subsp. japonica TaxID=39947 RepID=Q75L64_ORYSJ|nr:putative transposon protein [Oryza sativa Japonica Group]